MCDCQCSRKLDSDDVRDIIRSLEIVVKGPDMDGDIKIGLKFPNDWEPFTYSFISVNDLK